MKQVATLAITLTIAVLVLAPHAIAEVPQMINYQGRLTDTAGAPLSGMYSIKFRIYDSATDGNELWSSDGFVGVLVENGLFNHLLGESRLLPDSISEYDSLWLSIQVYNQPEFNPRTRLVSLLYSLRAGESDHSNHSDTASFAENALRCDTAQVALNFPGVIPVGAITAWLKSYPNTPPLFEEFVECNGQTITDPDSPYNGMAVPDLNGQNRFLRGNLSSGGNGGSDTHNHQWGKNTVEASGVLTGKLYNAPATHKSYDSDGTEKYFYCGGQQGELSGDYYTAKGGTLPTYYEVVWIIRIK
ncbi:MAG TPA: hypothetical protein VN285_08445 [Candidatus Deferrimicrobium sp.]|nr:hypothetical protein [Candidatus Deferrimicrobium sp.]